MNPVAVLAGLPALGGTLPPTYVVGAAPENLEEGIGLSPTMTAAVAPAAARRPGPARRPDRGPLASRRAEGLTPMCLGIPGQVVELVDGYAGQLALVDVQGAQPPDQPRHARRREPAVGAGRLGPDPHGLRDRADRPRPGPTSPGRAAVDGIGIDQRACQ